MTTICANCGFENPPMMRFCGNCGIRLVAAPEAGLSKTESLGAMVGSDLLERFRRAGLEARGQKRNVTILFADITSSTEMASATDSEVMYEIIRRFTEMLSNDVYKYEGMVDKFTGDGLMALFGAPIAHENNAELAVRAAVDMLADVARFNQEVIAQTGFPLRVRIGLNAGSVTVGGIGSNNLLNYTAIGNTVNLAQRIQDAAAPNTLLVSSSVYDATYRLFNYQPVPDLHLKGFPQPQTGYRFLDIKTRPASLRGLEGLHSPMIGRDLELSRLRRGIDNMLNRHQGYLAIIVGEGGIGKSRLVSELKSIAAAQPITILEGHSLTYRRNVAYWIFQDILRNYLQVTAETNPEETSQRLQTALEALLRFKARDIIPYFEHLLQLRPSDQSQRIDLLDASQLRQQVFLALRTWLMALASHRPVLLILEDLHWADDPSLDLLNYLLPVLQQQPIFAVAVSRPFTEGPMQAITDWARTHLMSQTALLALQSLSPSESQELLFRLVNLRNAPETLIDRIIQQASGIPFYLEEILRMLMDQRIIRRCGEYWESNPEVDWNSLGVPTTLQGLIMARFDRLAPSPRQLLQVASVIGRQFSLPVLQTIFSEQKEQTILQELETLVNGDFIQLETEQPSAIYCFRHAIVSDAIYSTLLKSDRAELHGRVARAIEQIYQDQLDSQVEILVRHYSWSQYKERALHYLILAGQQSARRYLNVQAHNYFNEAIKLLDKAPHTPAQAIQLFNGSGQVYLLTGDYPLARQYFERALELQSASPEEKSLLLRGIAASWERQGDYEQALTFLEKSRTIIPEQAGIEQAQILNDTGWIRFRRGEIDLAQNCLQQALSISSQTNRLDVTASILNRLGGVSWQTGDLNQASEYVQQSLALREMIGDTAALARSLNNLSLLNWIRGKWDAALENLQRCLELNTNMNDVEGTITAYSNLGLMHMERGEITSARLNLQKALDKAQEIGHTYNIATCYLNFCQLCVLTEAWDEAIQMGEQSLNIFEELSAREELSTVYTLVGLAWLGKNDLTQAERWAVRAQGLLTCVEPEMRPTDTDTCGRNTRLFGQIEARRQNYAQAEALIQESIAIFKRIDNHLELGRSKIELARLAFQRGDPASARKSLAEAHTIFEQLGARLALQQVEALSI